MSIIHFPSPNDSWNTTESPFDWFRFWETQTTENGITYPFQKQLSASVSPVAVTSYFQSLVDHNLLLPKNPYWAAYFSELLKTLSYASFKVEWNNIFLLPTTTLNYIHTQALELSVFECKNIIVEIDRVLTWLKSTPQLRSSYNHVRSIIFKRYEELSNNTWVPFAKDIEWESWEVIYLWELLQWYVDRTRFVDTKNTSPALSQKIEDYRKRVQCGILNLTNQHFSSVFDNICYTVLKTKNTPDFPREEIVDWIQSLSLFECQYLLDIMNTAIYPEFETNVVSRMAYIHMIKAYLERRVLEIKQVAS